MMMDDSVIPEPEDDFNEVVETVTEAEMIEEEFLPDFPKNTTTKIERPDFPGNESLTEGEQPGR